MRFRPACFGKILVLTASALGMSSALGAPQTDETVKDGDAEAEALVQAITDQIMAGGK